MKIIKEIEKSRLSEENMNEIKGGASGNNCSADVLYRSCGTLDGLMFTSGPCALKLSCPTAYATCSGNDTASKWTCNTSSGNHYVWVQKL